MDSDPERREIQRKRRRFRLLLVGTVLAFALVSLLVGLMAGGAFPGSWVERGDPPTGVAVTGGVLAVLGLVLEIVGLVGLVRSGSYRADRESRLWAVSFRRRRELARAVRRGVVDSPDDLPFLRTAAAQMVRLRRQIPIIGGLVTLNLGQLLLSLAPMWFLLFGVTSVMFAFASWQILRDAPRAEAFLREHPGDPAVTESTGSR
ncbi:hypothetical protein COO58_26050 [Micromonospora sp. WMMA1996]|uniref:hypothetical protein n=1 Tax=Micromonospora sp. WMMA1996 TaxID=2039878 RepID=UPI000BF95263|nr:hypothetical protein [Micromonospora sp. WMMA1996]PGH41299.1 hypothetical protein COO58_26050 [Micromonospora sp. WMMA1996]